MLWFTADCHLGHKAILTLGPGRPFDTIEDHDKFIIGSINRLVGRGTWLRIEADDA